MPRVDKEFKDRVYELVGRIPKGKVMTYGQIAAISGAAWAAWEVGQIAHTGPEDLPWWRVVSKQGGLASGYPGGGRERHKVILETEGYEVADNFSVSVSKLLWSPNEE
jgi:methylated-DNA-protein-cysteine methyltransferase-like protein